MKRVVLTLAAVVCLQAQPDAIGDWQGTLQAGSGSYRLVVHVVKSEAGLGGTLDSLDQGAFGLKVADIRLDGGTLRFALPQIMAQYQGDWNAEAGEFRGNWSQNGAALPLSLRRAPKAAAAAATPIGPEDREFLLGWLRRTGEAYAKALAGVTPSQWRYKPSPDRWSIADCAEHLVIAERNLFRLATAQVARIPMPEGQKRLGRAEDERLLQRMTDRTRKITAAEPELPKGAYASPADAARAFAAARAATVEWAASTQADLRGNGVKDAQGGFTDAYQFLLTLAAHTARHLAQIDEVKAEAAFPSPHF